MRIFLIGLTLVLCLLISIVSLQGQKSAIALSEMTTSLDSLNPTNKFLTTSKKSGIDIEVIQQKENQTIKKNHANKEVYNSSSNTDEAIRKFQQEFCGLNTRPNSNAYVTEYVLPRTCEMPLGIAVDSDAKKVWYVSTKKGVLGSYNIKDNKFDPERTIPGWKAREDPRRFSQVWDVKIERKSGDVWFTDEKQNAIWRYIKSSHEFEIYNIPDKSDAFGTIYPISIEFGSDNNDIKDNANIIFFVGTYSQSLWYADITKLNNGTSDGISQIPIPITEGFKGIDPIYITTGSLAFDSKRNAVWISVMAYSKNGQIFKYDLDTKSFDIYDLPKEINSPFGLTVDEDSGELWVTNPGTSIFYKFNPANNGNNGIKNYDNNDNNIVKFVTSMTSPRIFGNDHNDSHVPRLVNNINDTADLSKNTYTLPYWIKKSDHEGSLWINEWEGNKIAMFDPSDMKLIEYWIPSQNRLWGICSSDDLKNNNNNNRNDNGRLQTCGIANILQFSIEQHDNDNDNNKDKSIWFTEWSENKIGRVDVSKDLPFSVDVSKSNKGGLTIKRGESEEIKIKVKALPLSTPSEGNEKNKNDTIRMLASGTFTSTGDLGNSTGYFSKQSFSFDEGAKKKKEQISYIFTPSADLKPGRYTLMVGAENDAITYLRAIKIKIT
jgi:virginiamycin B lyase